jgi:hypothetical protein
MKPTYSDCVLTVIAACLIFQCVHALIQNDGRQITANVEMAEKAQALRVFVENGSLPVMLDMKQLGFGGSSSVALPVTIEGVGGRPFPSAVGYGGLPVVITK